MRVRALAAVCAVLVTTACDEQEICCAPAPDPEDGVLVWAHRGAVLFAETERVEHSGGASETVTLSVIHVFTDETDFAAGDSITVRQSRDESDQDDGAPDRGYWVLDREGDAIRPPTGGPGPHFPWPPAHGQQMVLAQFDVSDVATGLLADADVIVEGQVPTGTFGLGDESVTIDVDAVLHGEALLGATRHVVVEVGDVAVITQYMDGGVWLIDEQPDGSLQLVDTWLVAPWRWGSPGTGDALRHEFPEAAPTT